MDAFHHGEEAVRALRGDVLLETQLGEDGARVGGQYLPGRAVLVHGEQDGDQPAYDVGIAVANETQARIVSRRTVAAGGEPNLAGAAAYLVGVGSERLRKGRQAAPQLDDVAVAVLPVVEKCEIGADISKRHWSGPASHGLGGGRLGH